MAIDVNSLTHSRPSQVTNENRQPTVGRTEPSVQQQQTGKSAVAETVSMTDAAANLKKISSQMGKLPVVESKRVEEIKKAIENGDFEIDEVFVADKLIGMEKLLHEYDRNSKH
ncbi:MAG: flagellar biosynthesis anti-sigma factor FlgM [Gammaproteobacteria bacterium]|jgi:negative regulator of flagellin synthesis FlgM|nr:flagellar biosynthesis anti-sigma factor FlgM [Gammaproteobacteria bacterium]MBT4607910.1 flagellar biosynthesis anti-sigma factor FlgM [Thiotrichales bacterium]MBT3471780.1 flagellar biosynthesis anti-sigma factor FlgM [Gammaproteobacteria bacterium]MBT3966529.1 flagellar biosynthesis anti-sigma factor FlgM [Gammaproteobacteria bacterium]MBT4080885.1 flagellar biosynthesis anti-sigma factor FlgM [Gammaproteobacteria bacterium]